MSLNVKEAFGYGSSSAAGKHSTLINEEEDEDYSIQSQRKSTYSKKQSKRINQTLNPDSDDDDDHKGSLDESMLSEMSEDETTYF